MKIDSRTVEIQLLALVVGVLLFRIAGRDGDQFSLAGPATEAAASQPATLPAPPAVTFGRAAIEKMYQAELGASYDSSQFDRIYNSHLLLEQYFLCTSSAAHDKAVADIDAIGVDRSILGRIARIRLDWPDLVSGVYYINEKIGPHDVKYFLGIPKTYDHTRPWPLLIKLPTAQAFLTDPAPNADQVVKIYTQWVNDELAAHPDAVVIMPLLNLDLLYGPSTQGMNLVIQPMLHVAGKVNINPAQVYLMGHAMAALATWNIAIHYPTYFAAINPLAGSCKEPWQRLRVGNLRNVLPVVWHDSSDDVINVDESRAVVKYLRNLKYDVDYQETSALGHLPSPQVLDQEYAKLRSRSRDLYPQEVFLQSNCPDTIFNRADWIQIYQPIETGGDIQYILARGGITMPMFKNSFRIVGDIANHSTIVMAALNVQSLRLYLNDQMADLSKPVTVIVNEKKRFEGIIPQSTSEMLKDQVFLGRGWRYYTAVLDLDLTEPTTQPSTQPVHHGSIDVVLPNGEHKTYAPK